MTIDAVVKKRANGAVSWVAVAVLSFGGVVVAATLHASAPTLPWPASFVGLLLGVVVVLALVAALFRMLGLSNPKEAFGLPSGTVRTVLALGVMVLFAVCALTFLAAPAGVKEIGAWLAQGQAAQASVEPDMLKAEVERYEKAGWTVLVKSVGVNAAEPTKKMPAELTLFRAPVPSRDQSDMEKQVLTAITALMTTVVGFYFGSRTAEASRDKAAAGTAPVPDPIETGRKTLQGELARQDAAIAAAEGEMAALADKTATVAPEKAEAFASALDAAKPLQQRVIDQRKLISTRLADLVTQQSAAQAKPPAERSAFDTPLHTALSAAQDAVKGLDLAVKAWREGIAKANSLS